MLWHGFVYGECALYAVVSYCLKAHFCTFVEWFFGKMLFCIVRSFN